MTTKHRRSGGSKLLALLALFALLGATAIGCEKNKRVGEGWIPTPDGPVWSKYTIIGENAFIGEDMMMRLDVLEVYQADVEEPDLQRAATPGPTGRGLCCGWEWEYEGWRIPYEIHPSVYTAPANGLGQSLEDVITDALARWNDSTLVQFVPRSQMPSDRRRNFVEFTAPRATESVVCAGGARGCASVGRQGGRQYIVIDGARTDVRSVLHEMGHAAGLHHEHQRSDRDDFLVVDTSDADPDVAESLLANPGVLGTVGRPWGDYDYLSIMHYNPFAYAAEGIRMNPGRNIPLVYGLVPALSKSDVAYLDAQYLGLVDPGSTSFEAASYNALSILAAEDVPQDAKDFLTGDFDGDGRTDLASIRGADNRIWVSLGRSDGSFAPATSWHPSLCGAEACAVGDVNGDGDDDFVFATDVGLRIAASDGEGALRATYGSIWSPALDRVDPGDLHVADVSGDCKGDAIVADQGQLRRDGSYSHFVRVWDGRALWKSIDYRLGSPHEAHFADVDADGRADLIFVDAAGNVRVGLSNGTTGFGELTPKNIQERAYYGSVELWSAGLCATPARCSFHDMDGDGRADLVRASDSGSHHTDRVRVALSTGFAFRGDVANFTEMDCRAYWGCLPGDVNGDGLGDLIDPIGLYDPTDSRYDRQRGDVRVSLATPNPGDGEFWTENVGPKNYVLPMIPLSCMDGRIDPGLGY